MADLHRIIEAPKVGDDGDAEGADATVVGYNHLWNSGHTDSIATQDTIHLIFGRCLEGWSLQAHIDAILQADLLLACNIESHLDEQGIIGLMHIRETWSCGEVLATQRVLREEVDVVGDDHQVTNLETGVHATCGIADEEHLDA